MFAHHKGRSLNNKQLVAGVVCVLRLYQQQRVGVELRLRSTKEGVNTQR